MAASYDVPIVHFWQPQFITKAPSPADAEIVPRLGLAQDYRSESDLYMEILERSGTDAIDLSAAMDEVDVPVYFDWAHTNELGARIVGKEIYGHLRRQLEALKDQADAPS